MGQERIVGAGEMVHMIEHMPSKCVRDLEFSSGTTSILHTQATFYLHFSCSMARYKCLMTLEIYIIC